MQLDKHRVRLDQRLGKIWEQHKFEFSDPPPNYCKWARQFHEWADKLVADTAKDPTEIAINQSMLLLQKTYWGWYERVPVAHKNIIGTRNSHICIFQVYREAYNTLRNLELTKVSRPRFFEQPPKPPPQISGVFIGEALDELE